MKNSILSKLAVPLLLNSSLAFNWLTLAKEEDPYGEWRKTLDTDKLEALFAE